MKDGFQPQTPFEGYVYAKMESMQSTLDKIPCATESIRIGKIETDIANIKGKATIIGAVFGFIGGWIGKFLYK